jgi:hypothetical protein
MARPWIAPIERQQPFRVDDAKESLVGPDIDVLQIAASYRNRAFEKQSLYPLLKLRKMDVVARGTARDGKLPIRDLRAVQERQILVGQTEALLKPQRGKTCSRVRLPRSSWPQ